MENLNKKYDEYIMRKLRENNGLDEYDISNDKELQELSPTEVFEEVLEYEGIVGYSRTILSWIEDIYGIDLDRI